MTGDWINTIPPLSFTGTFTFANLQITWDTGNETEDGSLTIGISTQNGLEYASQESGSLSGTGTDSGFAYSYSYTNLDISTTSNDATGAYTADLSGNVTDSDLGTYQVTTLNTFQGNENNNPDNPTSGSGQVTATDNSSVTMVVLNNLSVRLDVDPNGDTIIDDVVNTTWDVLNAQ